MACAPSEDSDQPVHPPSLIRVFAVRMKKARVVSYPLSAQRRLWSDWADAQADLSLRWAHIPLCLFCREAAQLFQFLKPVRVRFHGSGLSNPSIDGYVSLIDRSIQMEQIFCPPVEFDRLKMDLTSWTGKYRLVNLEVHLVESIYRWIHLIYRWIGKKQTDPSRWIRQDGPM